MHAVSQQIARLERETGQHLVEKQGRGVRVTEAGAVLARSAGEVLTLVERVEAGLAGHRGVVAGPLAVAAFATAARGLLPGVLAQLRTAFPDLDVALSEQEPDAAVAALRRGHPDVAVVQDWADDVLAVPDGLSRRHLLDDPFDVALPAAHPLAGRAAVTVADLAGEDWIGWSTGQICHDWLSATLRRHGAQARIRHTASEHSTQLALVAAGLGAAVIPRLGRDPVSVSVSVPFDPQPTRRVFAVWRDSAAARPAVATAVDALASHAARLHVSP
ncbi:LysR family transcriptional regulator [Dactylosporangium cerinum]|uniref:LysR family transcriptional regulator n=1 Tax=Dactylosporangium cerinum TaxID=1434730 RepID=A0ABV9W5W5_9ACTN